MLRPAVHPSLKAAAVQPRQRPRDLVGNDRVVVIPFIVELHKSSTARAITDPLATLCAGGEHHAVITAPPPFLIETQYTHSMGDRSSGIDSPMPTQTGQQARALIVPPFLTSYYGTDTGTSIDEAMGTLTTKDRHALVVPPFILSDYTRISGLQAAVRGIDEALPTVPGRAVHYLVQTPDTAVNVDDCGFRMLTPAECGRAMAFPDTYTVLGNKREKIKQFGNAVTPPTMEFLIRRCIDTLR